MGMIFAKKHLRIFQIAIRCISCPYYGYYGSKCASKELHDPRLK